MRKINLFLLNSFFESNINVTAAWLFGSAKDGIIRDGRDIDIAILFEKNPVLDEWMDMINDLEEIIDYNKIDLVVLNRIESSITCFEAISGKSLFCRDIEKVAEYSSLIARRYEYDMAFIRRGLSVTV